MRYNATGMTMTKKDTLTPPREIRAEIPCSKKAAETVTRGRAEIRDILNEKDERLLVVIGPCSIHDEESALAYAQKLSVLREQYTSRMAIQMRAYFEKPRTTLGWPGLWVDPDIDGSFDIEKGRCLSRRILHEINELGLPTATEYLDPNTPQFIEDLVSWGAIGARTTENPKSRHMASGLTHPVGFKNGTSGNAASALDAIVTARASHVFLGIDPETGRECRFDTDGNPDTHLVLRGGAQGANHDTASLDALTEAYGKRDLTPRVMVDTNHGNSGKDHKKQSAIARDVAERRAQGDRRVFGLLIESHLKEGRQDHEGVDEPAYGVSITDPCIGWEETAALLKELHDSEGS